MSGLLQTLSAGGPVMVLLGFVSVASVMLIVVKTVQLSGVTKGSAARAAALAAWGAGDRVAATATMERGRTPADRVLLSAMQGLLAGTRRPALEADLEWRGNAELSRMTRHLRLLELIAMVSPLLGLLGTVLGMIRSFRELAGAEGSANASILAGGIWEALLTTAAGLVVAIPAAIAAGLLGERAERAAQMIEAGVGQLFAVEDGRR